MKIFWTRARIPIIILVTFTLYYIAAKIGLNLATLNKQASPVWPATGIALSAIILFGPTSIVGIFLAAFLVNLNTGLNLTATTMIAFGNTMEAVVFFYASQKILKQKEIFGVHTFFLFSLLVVILSTATSAIIGTGALYFNSIIPKEQILLNLQTWWVGDFLGALIITPITYKFVHSKWEELSLNGQQYLRFAAVVFISGLITHFIFSVNEGKPFLFLIFICILLPALWLNSVWVYVTSLCICTYSIYQTLMGNGPFTNSLSINNNLIQLQIFIAALAISALGLGSLKLEKFYWKSSLALMAGWALAGVTFYFSFNSAQLDDEVRFKSSVTQVENAISNRLGDYIQSLDGAAGFISASNFVSEREWQVFTEKILLSNRFPGINGIGLILPESSNSLYKQFQPSYDLPNSTAEYKNNEKYVITYIEPRTENEKSLGLNLSSELYRYQAIAQARDTGLPTVTRPIILVQDQLSRPGFLIILPVYKRRVVVSDPVQRKKALVGFVFAPIIYENFITSAISDLKKEVSLKIVDGSNEAYRSPDFNNIQSQVLYTTKAVAGHTIDFHWKRGPKFETSLSSVTLWIGFFGALFSMLFAILLSSLQNISNRAQKIADEMTKEVESRKRMWKALSDFSPIGIYVTDLNENCTYANSTWRQIHEIKESEVLIASWTSLIHSDDVDAVKSKWKSIYQEGHFSSTYRICKKNGDILFVSAQTTILKDEENKITGFLGTLLDITELHMNQTALVNSVKMSAIGQMAGGIAHEINNPLAILNGKLSVIEQMIANPLKMNPVGAAKHIQDMFGTIDRIAKIVRGLSAVAKDSKQEPFEACELQTVFENSLILCANRISNRGIKLLLPERIPDFVFFGRNEQISQVLINLLYNALDATLNHPHPWIKIHIYISDIAKIEISNSGPQIPEKLQNKVFDPFFTTKEVGRGMGLGLSVSKGIIERHNGRLYIDASKQNTTFVIELPALIENINVA